MLTAALAWLATYKYLVIFPIAVIEGPIIAIVAGSLAASGQMNFLAAYALIVSGDLAGDSLYYTLGRYGRTRVLHRWGHYIGLTPERMERVDSHFLRHAGRTLIIGKLAFSFEVPVIVSAGIARFSYVRFLFYMLIGAMPKTLSLMLIGYFFGFSITTARRDLGYVAHASLAAIIIVAVLIGIHWLGKRQAGSVSDTPQNSSNKERS